MQERIKITKYAKESLDQKKRELMRELAKIGKKQGNIELMEECERELALIDKLLKHSEVTEFSEKQPAVVILGTKVMIENLRTNDTREYIIMTRSTALPLKGIISNESPLAQKIMGLKLGNTFKFRDVTAREETYKIKAID